MLDSQGTALSILFIAVLTLFLVVSFWQNIDSRTISNPSSDGIITSAHYRNTLNSSLSPSIQQLDEDPLKVQDDYLTIGEDKPDSAVIPIDVSNLADHLDINDIEIEPWIPLGKDPLDSLRRTNRTLSIYLTWPFAADDLNLHNYRALESILHVYPEANKVQFLLSGPQFANTYKWANALSQTHFQKYWKRGYNVIVS